MPEGLSAEDGTVIDLDNVEREFAAAMAAPPADEPEAPAPPDLPAFDPEAPYGYKSDGTPKAGPGGRPPRKERARTQSAPKGGPEKPSKGLAAAGPKPDYTKGLKEFLAGAALGLAVLPMPNDTARIRCRVQASVIKAHEDGLASGIAITADNSGVVRWAVEKLTMGGGAWVFPAALAIMPFAMQTKVIWSSEPTAEMMVLADQVEAAAMDEFKSTMGIVDEDAQPAAA